MAKRELSVDEEISVKNIIKELCGYSVEEADFILKNVAAQIRECAIIEEAKDLG